MDQLKPAIEWCKRNIFWIGCFLLAVTMIGSWVFSSMQLASAQKKREVEIEKQVKALKKVVATTAEAEGEKAHPNKTTAEGMDAEIDSTIASIVKAWRKRYDEQKKILTWPEDILGKETCDFFSKVDVPEKVADPGQGFEKYRKAYYDEIPQFMNKICDNVGVNWQYNKEKNEAERKEKQKQSEMSGSGGGMAGGMGMGGMGGGMGNSEDTTAIDEINRYAVIWDEINQALWQQKLTEFSGYDDHTGTVLYPTYMQANMLQQDLWLLEAMFNNIKEINGKSNSNDTSIIRTIDHVVFGREAIVQLGSLSYIDARLAGSSPAEAAAPGMMGPGMMGPGMMGPGMMGPPGGAMGGPGMPGEDTGERIAYDKRYVDPEFESIAASQVKAVLGGEVLPEQNLELIVAKRVPFRIAVEMDERKINDFVAICANSEFVFEVNQLRINRHMPNEEIKFNGGATKNEGGMGGGYGGGMGMGGMGMGGMGMGMGMGMGDGMGGGSATAEALEPTDVESRTDFMVFVEFYGVVKIYNPVRENFLRKAAGQEVIDETADPSMVEPVPVAAPAAAAQPAATQPVAPAADAAAVAVPAGAPVAPAGSGGTAQPADAGIDPNIDQ
jgi:hypothetical protein